MTTLHPLRFWQIAAVLTAAFFPELTHAQDVANQGNLNVRGRRQVFKNVVAVRGKSDGENRVIVLATGKAVSAEALQKIKAKDAEDNVGEEVDGPHLKAAFLEDGTLRCINARGENFSFGGRGAPLEGKAVIADGKIRGSLKLVEGGDFPKDVSMVFDVAIDAPPKAAGPVKLDPPVKPTVTGKFVGNGKNAAVKFVTVEEHEEFSGKEAITLIFTEKDPATARKPSFDAMFGKLGSALILNVHHDGGIFGCQVAHSAHSKQGFTSLGQIHMVEFEIAGGNVKGQVSTGKELDTFGEKWEVDLKFAAPLPAKLRTTPPAAEKPAAGEPRESKKSQPKAPAGPRIAARKLPLPKDASDVEYKQVVEHIQFSSAQPVEAVAKEFSANLKQQGWKDGAGSLMGKKNAILKREQGDAKLTIMVQPAAAGSVVKVFTEGLDWSGDDEGKPPAPKKESEDGDDIEQQVDKLLKDALKKLPKGL